MVRDIKTRNVKKDVKSLDKTIVSLHHMKDITDKSKQVIATDSNEPQRTPNNYAQGKIAEKGKYYTRSIVSKTKLNTKRAEQYIKEKQNKKLEIRAIANDENKMFQQSNQNASVDSKNQKQTVSEQKKKMESNKVKQKSNKQNNIKNKQRKTLKSNLRTSKGLNTLKARLPSQKKFTQQRSVKKVLQSNTSKRDISVMVKQSAKVTQRGVKAVIGSVKKIVEGARLLYIFLSAIGGIACICILLIALAGAIFMTNGSTTGESSNLSQEVISYTPLIQKYANEFEIPHYVNAIQAIMMQESGGRGNDPMQSSECVYNTKYPQKPNGIMNPEYSIEVGVQNFADCLKRAKCKDAFDISRLSLAWQGYNFGNGYIEWAIKNFGGYSQGNAKVFADEQAKKHGWKSYGDPEYVPHVMRYYQFSHLGTGSSKLVNIALSQVGNQGGTPYWSWWGYKERVEWCAIFISWCADQAGMLEDKKILKFENVTVGMNWFKEKNQWLEHGLKPSTGMLIFFDWENDGVCDHVGLVEKVENNVVYTVEGNSNDQVRQNTYNISSNVIMGYGMFYEH